MRRTIAATAAAVALALTACGDDSSPSGSDTTALPTVATTAAVSTTTAATTTAPVTTPTPTAPPTTAAPTTAADPGRIVVDADTDPLRTAAVPVGTAVTLTVRSATPREFHLHGYDLEQTGTEVVFQFTADLPGSFELEAHDTGQVLLVLDVA